MHLFLFAMFVAGAALTGFGHDMEMIALGILVLITLVYVMFPKRS